MHKFFKRKKGDFYCTNFYTLKKLKEKLLYETKLFVIEITEINAAFFYIAVNSLYNVKWTLKSRKKSPRKRGFPLGGKNSEIFFITKNLGFKSSIYLSFTYSWPHQLERAAMLLFIIFCLKLRTWNVNARIFKCVGVLRIKWGMHFCFKTQQ